MSWETIDEDAWCWSGTHLFRYEPDVVNGGAYLKDQEGNNWVIRTCVICHERQRRQVLSGEDIADILAADEAEAAA